MSLNIIVAFLSFLTLQQDVELSKIVGFYTKKLLMHYAICRQQCSN